MSLLILVDSWVERQLKDHPDELWEDGVKDYLSHASNIMVILFNEFKRSIFVAHISYWVQSEVPLFNSAMGALDDMKKFKSVVRQKMLSMSKYVCCVCGNLLSLS